MKTLLAIFLGLIALAIAWRLMLFAFGLLAGVVHLAMALLFLAAAIGVVLFVVGLVRQMLRA